VPRTLDGRATIAPSETSDLSQITGRGFAAVLLDIEAQLLALAQGAQTRTLDRLHCMQDEGAALRSSLQSGREGRYVGASAR